MSGTHLQRSRKEGREELFSIGQGLVMEMSQLTNIVQNDMSERFKGKEVENVEAWGSHMIHLVAKLDVWSENVKLFYTDNDENNLAK